MVKTDTRTIDGSVYVVTQLPAMRAFKTLNRLGRTIGPAVAKLMGAGSTDFMELDAAFLGSAVEALFERLSDDDLQAITEALLYNTTVDKAPLNFDLEFAGRMDTLLKVLKFAFEVNYGSFFDGLRKLASQAPAKSTSTSPST